MTLRICTLLVVMALAGAAGLTALHGDTPLDERLLHSETERVFPEHAGELNRQPPAVRLILLDYADDTALVHAARHALERHPQLAPEVLAEHGAAEPFRDILRIYGAAVIPPIAYYRAREPGLTGWRGADAEPTQQPIGPGANHREGAAPGADDSVHEAGERAIALIREHGHGVLGQFVIAGDGEVARLQSERVASGVKRFFTSGLTNVEEKWRTGEEITAADYGWATVDVMLPIAALRLARGGQLAARAARPGAAGAQAGRASLQVGRSGRLVAVGGGLAGVGYVAMNPGIISSIGADIADALGLPAWLVTGALWLALLLPLLLLAGALRRWLVRPAIMLLRFVMTLLAWLHARLEGAAAHTRDARAGDILAPSSPSLRR